ncbi:MAG: RsmD family RNA methyltransferase [Bacteroidetes bacterium]|nr:RsmD family RNA methyltransferase [Bacteroidota bacterium]
MRIISGEFGGRIISPPSNFKARPTTDFAKENLFNVLNNRLDYEECDVLDLFGGTGGIGYEFASRGAKQVTTIEMDFHHSRFIEETIKKLKIENMKVVKTNVFVFIKRFKATWDVVFADPPYALEGIDELPNLIFEKKLLNEGGLFIFEHSKDKDYSSHPHFKEKRTYGSVNFSFFQ